MDDKKQVKQINESEDQIINKEINFFLLFSDYLFAGSKTVQSMLWDFVGLHCFNASLIMVDFSFRNG